MIVLEGEKPRAGFAAEENIVLCWITVNSRLFGIDTRQIREVLGPRTVQAVPLAPPFLAGILAYRGEVLTAVSLRCLLGLPPLKEKSCVLVLDGEGSPFGLVVDRVGGVVEVQAKTLSANPATLDATSRILFSGSYRSPEGLLVQLNAERLGPEQLAETGLFKPGPAPGGVQ